MVKTLGISRFATVPEHIQKALGSACYVNGCKYYIISDALYTYIILTCCWKSQNCDHLQTKNALWLGTTGLYYGSIYFYEKAKQCLKH